MDTEAAVRGKGLYDIGRQHKGAPKGDVVIFCDMKYTNRVHKTMHILDVQSSVALCPQNAPKSLAAGALPQTPLGELTELPRPLAGFKRPTSKDFNS